jgi:very-short-patch-repair endonuclease
MRLTTPARTLFDLASVLDGPALCSAVEDCRNRNLVSAEELDVIASRLVQRGRPGSVLFRSIAKPLLDAAPSESGYEVTVRRALCETGLSPTPQYPLRLPNGRQIRLDLALVESRIDVELDPAPTHAAPTAVAADKARDVQVALAGWQTLRFSEDDIDHRLRSLVGYVRALHLQRQAA